jgi:short-subunit dehydrogenase
MVRQERSALVTGASSGIGRETAVKLARAGFQVIAAARRRDRLEDLAQHHPSIIPRPVDLSLPEDVAAFCRELHQRPEPITILINNAGYSIRGGLEDVSLSAARRLFEVNFFALLRVTQACLPGMRRLRRGTIVNLSSIVGKFAFPFSGVYAASKHALEAVCDALRLEVRPFGIRVVTIRPGPIASEFNEAATHMTGDLMGRTDPDYKPVYQASGAGLGRLFSKITIPGPEMIAEVIVKAVLSDSPEPVYAAGPLIEEIYQPRLEMDDKQFDQFLSELTGLKGFKSNND